MRRGPLCGWLTLASLVIGCHGQGEATARKVALSAKPMVSAPLSFGTTAGDIAFGSQYPPAAAYGAGVFLTVWQSLTSPADEGFYAVRTRASDGMVLDQRRVPIWPGSSDHALASDGNGFLLVWLSPSQTLLMLRLDADGNRLGNVPQILRNSHASAPVIGFGAGYYLVAWVENLRTVTDPQYDVYARRVRASDGQPVDPVISLGNLPTEETAPAVAFDGSNFLVVWQDRREGGPRALRQPGEGQ